MTPSAVASVSTPPGALVCEMPRSEWRGTIVEAAREAERGGVTAFASAGRAGSSVRAITPGELVQTVERASALLGPGAAPSKVYTLGDDGTIYNTVTSRAEYIPVSRGPALVCQQPAAVTEPPAAPAPAPASPGGARPDRGALGKVDDALSKAQGLVSGLAGSWVDKVMVTPLTPGAALPKEARDAAKKGIDVATRWVHDRIDDMAIAETRVVFGRDSTVGNAVAAAMSAPSHLVADLAAGLGKTVVSTPSEVAADFIQGQRGGVQGLETALDSSKDPLERIAGGAQAVAVVAGDVAMVAGGVEAAAGLGGRGLAAGEAGAASRMAGGRAAAATAARSEAAGAAADLGTAGRAAVGGERVAMEVPPARAPGGVPREPPVAERAPAGRHAPEVAPAPSTLGLVPREIPTSSGVTIQPVPGKTTTILGRYGADMKGIIEDRLHYPKTTDFGPKPGGYNVLNVDTPLQGKAFWSKYNEPFLDEAISRGDPIRLATPLTDANLVDRMTNELTGYGQEIKYLQEHGYKFDPQTHSMVRVNP